MSDTYEYVGTGPAATGGSLGWEMRPELFARCGRCGDFISLDPSENAACGCGALSKDSEYGRLGSSLGDDSVEVYRRT